MKKRSELALSKEMMESIKKIRQLPDKLITHSIELEQLMNPIASGDVVEGDNEFNKIQDEVARLLGIDLIPTVVQIYHYSNGATLESKICCAELVRLGSSLLDLPFPLPLKIALFQSPRIIGYMFDRSDESYFICSPELMAFLKNLELFMSSLGTEDNAWFVKIVLDGDIGRFKEMSASLQVKFKASKDLEQIKSFNMENS